MQQQYKVALEEWIAAIRAEEQLVYSQPAVKDVDRWEEAHRAEENARKVAKQLQTDYEDAVRKEQFGF